MRAWIQERPQFNGREAGPLKSFFASVTEIGGIGLNESESGKSS
jgi:hypothetical protein